MQSEIEIKQRFNKLMGDLIVLKNNKLFAPDSQIDFIGARLEELRRILNYWGTDLIKI